MTSIASKSTAALVSILLMVGLATNANAANSSKAKLDLTKLAEVKPGIAAPDFALKDGNGKTFKLSDYKNKKYVVLEWYNKSCPFVRKQYDSHNMQNLQEKYTAKDVVWFQISSSAKGHEGYLTAKDALKAVDEEKSHATALLLDSDGKVGHEFGAKTTPHMFVISPEGKVIYAGAIDDKPTTETADVQGANNYVVAALDAQLAVPKKPVAVPFVKPYGCGVKY